MNPTCSVLAFSIILVLPVGFLLASTLGLDIYDILPPQYSISSSRYSYSFRESATLPPNAAIDLNWYPPNATWETSIPIVINGTGTYGLVFNSSQIPSGDYYGVYDWCNMPHVRKEEYVRPGKEYGLEYVELVSLTSSLPALAPTLNPFNLGNSSPSIFKG